MSQVQEVCYIRRGDGMMGPPDRDIPLCRAPASGRRSPRPSSRRPLSDIARGSVAMAIAAMLACAVPGAAAEPPKSSPRQRAAAQFRFENLGLALAHEPVGARGLIYGLGDDAIFAIDPADYSARVAARHDSVKDAHGLFAAEDETLYYGSGPYLWRAILKP